MGCKAAHGKMAALKMKTPYGRSESDRNPRRSMTITITIGAKVSVVLISRFALDIILNCISLTIRNGYLTTIIEATNVKRELTITTYARRLRLVALL